MANSIIEQCPKHIHYVEPYFGGGSVLFAKPIELVQNHSELVNDVNSNLTNFWIVLLDETMFARFRRAVEATPFSKVEWERAASTIAEDKAEMAVNFFVKFRQFRQGLGIDFATMSRSQTRRGMNEQLSSWLSAIDGLEAAHERLTRVVICCEDAISIIEREDSPSTLYYLDPPYLHETRSARKCCDFEMADQQHRKLLEMLSSISGSFLLSGYRSQLYDGTAQKNSWNRTDFEIDNKASSQKVKPLKIECLWRNF